MLGRGLGERLRRVGRPWPSTRVPAGRPRWRPRTQVAASSLSRRLVAAISVMPGSAAIFRDVLHGA